MAKLTDSSPEYNPEGMRTHKKDVEELVKRIRQRPDVIAAGVGEYSHPYYPKERSLQVEIDSMITAEGLFRRQMTPDYIRVFRYQGVNGETPDQLAEMLEKNTFLASDDIFMKQYGQKLSSYNGRGDFYFNGDSSRQYKLAASLMPVRYDDFTETMNSSSLISLYPDYYSFLEICLRVHPDQDIDFINKIKEKSLSTYRIGNIYIADIQSFDDIRRTYLQEHTNEVRNYLFGIAFLLLNIFIGLLGTFWFRIDRRRSQIALMKSFGANSSDIFIRQITEGFIILCIATIPAIIIDLNIAKAELNAWRNMTTLEPGRFIITICITFALIALMMFIGILIPARRAMKIQPAEALHNE